MHKGVMLWTQNFFRFSSISLGCDIIVAEHSISHDISMLCHENSKISFLVNFRPLTSQGP